MSINSNKLTQYIAFVIISIYFFIGLSFAKGMGGPCDCFGDGDREVCECQRNRTAVQMVHTSNKNYK